MGWFKTREKCEGYVVGLVRDDKNEAATAWVHGERFRELGTEADRARCDANPRLEIPFRHFRVGCDCGWRSPVMIGRGSWAPSMATLAHKTDDDRAAQRWGLHHDLEEQIDRFDLPSVCARQSAMAETARFGRVKP